MNITADLTASPILSAIRFKALEDLLNNLSTINVLPLATIINAAKVLAVQA